MSLRALHIVNEPSGPGGLFLPPLRAAASSSTRSTPPRRELPKTLAGYDAVISCGGTANTHETDVYPWIDDEIELLREALRDGVPVIGLCLGAQLLTKAAGGEVLPLRPVRGGLGRGGDERGRRRRRGARPTCRSAFMAMQWHHYACELPPGAVELARNPTCLQAFRLGEAAWGTQFHIEVTREILLNWMRWGEAGAGAGRLHRGALPGRARRPPRRARGDRPRHGRALRRARRRARPQRRLRAPAGLDQSRDRGLYSDRPRV